MWDTLPSGITLITLYACAITVVSVFFMGYDKYQARLRGARTPEATLWFLALLGGTPGILLGMHVFRHKTKKISFQLILVLILLGQLACALLYANTVFHGTIR